MDDEDPLYDKVPSDEDYASVASESSSTIQIGSDVNNGRDSPGLATSPPPKPSKQFNYNSTNGNSSHNHKNNNKTNLNHSNSHKNSPSPHSASTSPSTTTSNLNKSSTPTRLFPTSHKEHKILNTRFEKVPIQAAAAASAVLAITATSSLPSGALSHHSNNNSNGSPAGGNNSVLVANAESCLNSIINSLNQIDYSHLTGGGGSEISNDHRNYCGMTTDSFELAQMGHANNNGFKFPMATGRGDLYNELKNENELMQAMVRNQIVVSF